MPSIVPFDHSPILIIKTTTTPTMITTLMGLVYQTFGMFFGNNPDVTVKSSWWAGCARKELRKRGKD